MLTRKHVLVLGAGASQPYSFPTGAELSALVARELLEGHNAFNALIETGLTQPQIRGFRDAFFRSGKNSVDAFLEHRADLMEIGKLATAAVLIPYEREEKLFAYENSWLRYLYNKLNTSFDDFVGHQLAVVTFNYDRNVEHFIFTSLQNSYNKPPKDCLAAMQSLPIIHLHGTLGPLPWQVENSNDARPYDFNVSPIAVRTAAANIKIIHEDIKDGRDKEFARAKTLIKDAYRVLFLGFGYNRTNLQRLGVEEIDKGKCLGTSVNMGIREKNDTVAASNNRIELRDGDCLHFVRELIRW